MVSEGKNFKIEEQPVNQKILVKLNKSKAVASGESKYGKWFLWVFDVVSAKVSDRNTKAVIDNYTGEATAFFNEELNNKLITITNGTKEGVQVLMYWHPEITENGTPQKKIEFEVSSSGQTPPVNIGYTNDKLISDFLKYVEYKVVDDSKDAFTIVAKNAIYKCPEDKIDQMYNVYLERKAKK